MPWYHFSPSGFRKNGGRVTLVAAEKRVAGAETLMLDTDIGVEHIAAVQDEILCTPYDEV